MWGVSLTLPLLFHVRSFSYTPLAVLCGEFLLQAPCCYMCGISLTRPLLFYVGSFSYTPCALLCEEFLLHASSCFMWGVSLTRPGPFCFMRGVSLTHPRLFSIWRFSCKLLTFVTRKLTNQWKNKVCWLKSVYRASDQASVSCHQNDMANEPNGSSQSITDWTEYTGGSWRRHWHLPLTDAAGLDTPRYRQTEAQSQHNQSVTGFCFTSIVFISFFLSFTFSSGGLIVTTVKASISLDIVYCRSNLKWMDRWIDGWIPTHTIGRLSCPVLFYVGSFSFTPHAASCGDILLHTLCWFMWGLSILCGDIITCLSCCFTCGVFLKFLMLFYVGSFSDTPDAVLRGEFLLHTPCYLMWEDSLTCRILFYVVSFFDITHTGCFLFSFFLLSGKCLLDSACCFMWWFLLHYSCFFIQEVYFPCPTIFDIRNFSCTSYASLCGDIFK